MRTTARFPALAATSPHYESFYIKATSPEGGRALWLRHTIHQRPGHEATASLWLTYFDADADGPRAGKVTVPAGELSFPPGAYIRIGEAVLEPGAARGALADESLPASWDLRFTDAAEPLHHLPYERMYTAKLPRTKLLSPHPSARFDGELRLGDEAIEVAGWRGMVGHNWGAEHAERWVWLHAAGLNGNEGDYFDVAAGRIRIGPFTTPWVANGMIVLDGEAHRLGGLGHVYGTVVEARPGECEFTFPGKGVNVRGRVQAPLKDFVAWVYADPKGPEHNTINCSIADIELKVERPGRRHGRVAMAGAAAYELGMRESDHGVPLQPYPDG
ncbi:MAG TPA: hypothetical protein VIL04_08585 [Solirubrobacterales bacterium]